MFQSKTVPSILSPSSIPNLISNRSAPFGWPICLVCSLAALLAPALWNGYAVTFYDTCGYVIAALEMHLVPGRSLFYGLFLWASSLDWQSFWGPVLVQSLSTLWLIRLMLRCHGLYAGPQALAFFSVGLASLTGISWYTSQLMPDILVPLVVLALWLLGFHWPKLGWKERTGLVTITLLGLLSHMSCLALSLGLSLVILAAWMMSRRTFAVFIVPPLAVVLAGLMLMPLLHLSLTGKGGYTPGGSAFLFGRLVQDGIAQRWLAEYCPAPGVKLCDVRHRLPATADDFLWNGGSPFQDIGGWAGYSEPELKRLTWAAVTAYPGMTLWTTLRSTAQQMIKVATGDALDESHSDTRGIITGFLPDIVQSFYEARQQQGQITQVLFDRLNLLHVPVALLSVLGLLPAVFWSFRNGRHDLAALALFVFLALLGNAFICGALSNPHDRYQSRLVWLASLVVGMTMAAYWEGRNKVQSTDLAV